MSSEEKRNLPSILDGKFFVVLDTDDSGKVKARCLQCDESDKKSVVSGSIHPTSNFTSHLKRYHRAAFEEYGSYVQSNEVRAKRAKQTTLPFTRTIVSSGVKTQTERAILDYIVHTMQPISVVEQKSFRKLCVALNAEAVVMCRNTCRSRIDSDYLEKREVLIKRMSLVGSVCLTADIWSSRGRSFMGLTAHWLTYAHRTMEVERHSVALALRRFQGVHSNDRIAEMLHDIMRSFKIENKVVCVVTDNASNFVKAFKVYGRNYATECGLHLEEAPDFSDVEDDIDPERLMIEPDDFPGLDEVTIRLPFHIRCASHTLSLIATKDIQLNQTDDKSKAVKRKTMRAALGKCSAIWNKTARSVQAAEAVKSLLGFKLPKPVITRWNSTFDSITKLLTAGPHLDNVCAITGTPKFTKSEIDYLDEFIMAMKPIACALDKLQSEKNFYFGFLAPTIFQTRNQLEGIIHSAPNSTKGFAPAIASELQEGLKARFDGILSFNLDLAGLEIMAAVSIPLFKLRWIPMDKRDLVKNMFVDQAKKFVNALSTAVPAPGNDIAGFSEWNDIFFDEPSPTAEENDQIRGSVEIECLSYLQDSSTSLQTLLKYPTIKDMFLYYNTPLASSAPAERLFSYAGMILRPKRSNLSDELFEELCFLKLFEE